MSPQTATLARRAQLPLMLLLPLLAVVALFIALAHTDTTTQAAAAHTTTQAAAQAQPATNPACPNPAAYAPAMPMGAAFHASYAPLPTACASIPIRWTTGGQLLTGWDTACDTTDGHAYRWARDGELLTDTAACDTTAGR